MHKTVQDYLTIRSNAELWAWLIIVAICDGAKACVYLCVARFFFWAFCL